MPLRPERPHSSTEVPFNLLIPVAAAAPLPVSAHEVPTDADGDDDDDEVTFSCGVALTCDGKVQISR